MVFPFEKPVKQRGTTRTSGMFRAAHRAQPVISPQMLAMRTPAGTFAARGVSCGETLGLTPAAEQPNVTPTESTWQFRNVARPIGHAAKCGRTILTSAAGSRRRDAVL
jgi:hypothetical protein